MTHYEMYRTLGVRCGASSEEIKDAYRKLVKKYHPDVTKTSSSEGKLTKVIEAYKTLIVTGRNRNLVEFPVNKEKKSPKARRTGPGGAGGTAAGPRTAAQSSQTRSRPAASGGGTQTAGGRSARTGPGGPDAADGAGQNAQSRTTSNSDIFSLGKLLENGKTVGMRAFAARSLGNTGKRTAYAFLRKALYDPSELVVKTAVEAIGNLKISQSYGELFSIYSRGSTELRETVLYAVGKIGVHGAFRDIIETAKSDREFSVRSTARKLAAEYGREKAVSDG